MPQQPVLLLPTSRKAASAGCSRLHIMEQPVACCLQEAGPPPAQRRCLSDTRHPQAPVGPQQQHPHQPQVGCWPDSLHVDHAQCHVNCRASKQSIIVATYIASACLLTCCWMHLTSSATPSWTAKRASLWHCAVDLSDDNHGPLDIC